jgi:hypothetical protein
MITLIKRFILIGLLGALLAACSPAVTPGPIHQLNNPYAPQAGDESLIRDNVQIVKTEIATQESSPLLFSLKISFFKPTTCHQFRVVASQPGANRQINIEVYSLMKKNQVCTLMATLDPTEAIIIMGSLPAGHYTVMVNGVKSAEFDA